MFRYDHVGDDMIREYFEKKQIKKQSIKSEAEVCGEENQRVGYI